MLYTKDSEKICKHILKSLNGFNNIKLTGFSSKILLTFFNDIEICNKLVEQQLNNDIIKIRFIEEVDKPSLYESKFVSNDIYAKIEEGIGVLRCNIMINELDVTINVLLYNKNNNSFERAKNIIKKVIIYLKFIQQYSGKNGSLKIYLYLTDLKKKLPGNNTEIIGSNNANTAVTYACIKDGEIYIYRYEEWFKVLIHEIMHSLCLDFSPIQSNDMVKLKENIKSIFKIKSTFDVAEAYTEFWANIINLSFISYYSLKGTIDRKSFLEYFESHLNIERAFSIYQMNKILSFLDIDDYNHLYDDDKVSKNLRRLYKEDTNIFSYYILKMILLYNTNEFLKWNWNNNTNIIKFNKNNSSNYNKLFKFVEKKYKSEKMLEDIKHMKRFSKKSNDDKFLRETLRMTVFDLLI